MSAVGEAGIALTGPGGFLAKPFEPDTLLEMIRTLLTSRAVPPLAQWSGASA